jgi:fatty-acid desaturase
MKFLNPTNHLTLLHAINHIMIIPAVIYGSVGWWIATAALWFVIATVGVSIGWHRNLSHRSFNCPVWFENLTALIGCFSFAGSPIGWVGVHRMHHANSDNDLDPHSPKNNFWRSYFHRWGNIRVPRKYVKSLFSKPFIKFLHRHYFAILYTWLGILLLINPLAAVFFFSMVSVLAVHGFASVNALSHTFGYRNYNVDDDSRNNWYANVMTAFSGEGWHNNHHALQGSHRFGNIEGVMPREIDAGAWIIESLGYAKDRYKLK